MDEQKARQNNHELENQIGRRGTHGIGNVGAYVCASREGAVRDEQLVQFPVTFAVWSIFVLLIVKLK
jgi:hypothetical protein